MALVSDFGGFFESVFIFFSLIPFALNNQLVLEKFVRRLYFVEGDQKLDSSNKSMGTTSVMTRREEIKFSAKTFKNKFLSFFKRSEEFQNEVTK